MKTARNLKKPLGCSLLFKHTIVRVDKCGILEMMYNHRLYLLYWIISAAVLYAGFWARPELVILGNGRFTAIDGMLYAGFWLTFIVWSMWDVVISWGGKLGNTWKAWVYFGIVNVAGVWLVSRWPNLTGLKIEDWMVIAALGLVINLGQRGVRSWIFG